MSSHFSPEAAAAFGRRKTGPNVGFTNAAATAFGRQPLDATNTFAAFGKGAVSMRPDANFDTSAVQAFGKGVQRNSGFDADASAAFGKKPSRRPVEEPRGPVILPKRTNDLGSIMEHYLGQSEPSREYNQSAFGLKRAAAAAAPKAVVEEWPELGGGKAKTVAKPPVSFSDVMKKRAEADAVEAAVKAREEALLAASRRQDRLDIGGIFLSRPPIYKSKTTRRVDYDEVIESDLDYVKGDDTAGVLPEEDGAYYDQDEDESAPAEDDEYWKR